MNAAILEKIESVNQMLFHLLEETRRSLVGQADFNVETIRQLSLVVAEMDVVLPRSTYLRAAHPELVAPLDHYLRMVSDLRSELQKVHVRLLGQRTELEAARTQLHAVSQFTSALSSTRETDFQSQKAPRLGYAFLVPGFWHRRIHGPAVPFKTFSLRSRPRPRG